MRSRWRAYSSSRLSLLGLAGFDGLLGLAGFTGPVPAPGGGATSLPIGIVDEVGDCGGGGGGGGGGEWTAAASESTPPPPVFFTLPRSFFRARDRIEPTEFTGTSVCVLISS